jgi:hypothetical protein
MALMMTTGNVQERSGMNAKLLNGSEGKDIEKVLPVAVWHPGGLGLDHTGRGNKLGEVSNCRTGMMLV